MLALAPTSSPLPTTASRVRSTTGCERWAPSRAAVACPSAPTRTLATCPTGTAPAGAWKTRSSASRAPSPAWRWCSAPASTAAMACRCPTRRCPLTNEFSSSRCAGGCGVPSRSSRKKSENCSRATTSRTRRWKRPAPRLGSRSHGPAACTPGRSSGSSNFWKKMAMMHQ